jgi:hypothetical protein
MYRPIRNHDNPQCNPITSFLEITTLPWCMLNYKYSTFPSLDRGLRGLSSLFNLPRHPSTRVLRSSPWTRGWRKWHARYGIRADRYQPVRVPSQVDKGIGRDDVHAACCYTKYVCRWWVRSYNCASSCVKFSFALFLNMNKQLMCSFRQVINLHITRSYFPS